MNVQHVTNTGIDTIGDAHWGSHYCLFYQNSKDLIDILIPYFKTGLMNNEFCIWVISGELDEKTTKESLEKAIPGFKKHLEREQIEIIPNDEWYLTNGSIKIQQVLDAWIKKHNQAMDTGYNGMRVAGDVSWLKEKERKNIIEYENRVNTLINKLHMITICTYSLDKCSPFELADVINNHHSTLIKRKNKWELIENSELKRKKEALSDTGKQLHILQGVMAALHSTLELREVFKKISDGAVNSMGYTTAFILTLDDEENNYIIRSLSAKNGILSKIDKVFGFPIKNLRIPANRGINKVIESLEGGNYVIVKILEEILSPIINKIACRAVQKLTGTKNYILVPFIAEGELVGAMFVSSSMKAVTDDELDIIQSYATIAAQAIKNAELYTQSVQAKEALKQSELKFKNLFENAKDAVLLTDTKTGIIVNANSAACTLLGRPKEEIIGMHQIELHPPELVDYYKQNFREHVEKGYIASEEMVVQRADGNYVPVDISTKVIKLNGKLVIQGVFRDITERKQAEEVLEIERQNFHNSMDNSPLGIRILNRQGDIIYCNRAAIEIFGYSSVEEFNAVPFEKRYTPESLIVVNKRIEARIKGESLPQSYEVDIVRKDGQIRNMIVSHQDVVWNGERQYQSIWQDITEYKKAEEALRESQEFTNSLLENAPHAVIVFNPDTSVRYVNPAWVDMNGWTADEIIGTKNPYPWWPEEYEEIFTTRFSLALQKDKGQAELITKKKNGENYWIAINWAAVKRNGEKVYTPVNSVDITKRKKRETLQNDENSILTLMNQGAELSKVLDAIVKLRESYHPGVKSSIMLFDSSRENLVLASGPNLPDDCIEILKKGIPVKPSVEFSGVEQYIKERLIIPDIRNSPISKPNNDIIECLTRNNLLSCWSQPIFSSDGNLLGVIVSYGDKLEELDEDNIKILGWAARITALAIENRRAEIALSESEERFSKAFRASANAICIISMVDDRFIEVNESFTDFTGYTREEAIGRNGIELGLWADEKELKNFTRKMKRNERVYNEEFHSRMKTGEVRVGLMSTEVIDIGREPCRIVVITDITDHKKIEQALEVERHNFRNSIDNSPLGIIILDEARNLVYVNRVACDMHGYENAEEFYATPTEKRYTPESLIKVRERDEATSAGISIPDTYEVDIIRKDGQIRNMMVYRREVIWNGKKQFQTLWQDDTEPKKAQEQLILSDRLASVGELAAGVAHELNNPLTSVIGFSQLLLGKNLPDDVKEDIKIVCNEAQRTAAIVKNLLTFARKHTPVKQMMNVNNTLEQVMQMRAYEQRVSNIQVVSRFASDLPEIMADQFQLQQVFLNIIINAEYFMIEANQGGTLTITTENTGDIIRISFVDDGPGISKENLKHLFDPFFTTKEVGKGTGLGLSICHGIITEHNGNIYAENVPGKGAAFIIELPVRNDYAHGVLL